ncbi:nucleotidyltransferase [Oceanispirochaeta sp.]|jgi:predicted nucleotidyltransferase|uniref:nucleotidyltransferase n=1 Tax=Oceanispirochaeta sp. TaxID=2035350 RepID=UPI002609163A|nr:nucleotidyltransferase [Oceanispirochaeta sp.]MDA3958297.1 nucleotidyltransferase [Oceanispirochaeta sp.]
MVSQSLPEDFKEFLRLLNEKKVDYLLIGGYAVGYYGYPRTTADMDIFVAINQNNAKKLKDVFIEFGMISNDLSVDLFLEPGNIVRMGLPPMRIEILNEIDGVDFEACYSNRNIVRIDDIMINLISLPDLKENKRKSNRYKDLDDLEHLK